jgi:hypothetical protein
MVLFLAHCKLPQSFRRGAVRLQVDARARPSDQQMTLASLSLERGGHRVMALGGARQKLKLVVVASENFAETSNQVSIWGELALGEQSL